MVEASSAVPSLRRRLSLALIAPLIALFLIGGAAAYLLAQHFADSVYDGWLFDSVNSLAQEVDKTPRGPSVVMPASTQRLFEWDAVDKTYFRISGARHGVIAGRRDLPDATGDIDFYERASIYDAELDGQEVRVASLELPAKTFGESVRVEVAETTRKRHALARVILLSTLVPQLILIAVAAAAIRRAVIHGLGPLRAIAARVHERSYRDLEPIADSGVPDEVRPLTRALNDLFARLLASTKAQQRFIAEAAHQLRTPLTAIKLQVGEVLRAETLQDARPTLDALRASTDRAVRLSNQLLTLARAEHEASTAKPFEVFDLVALVRETGAEWAPRALQAGMDMHFSAEPENLDVPLEGNADLLREAIGNLLDNAIKYRGSSGATIQLRVGAVPAPCIDVQDDGPGISPPLRAEMLRHFVRGAPGEGSGLGLPIALEIAQMHRGELVLETAQSGHGLLARMIFPRTA